MTKNKDSLIPYDDFVQSALRQVVRSSIEMIALHGLPGDHHFYISFKTDAPGVSLPAFLRKKFPEEMTIVIQNQYSLLRFEKDALAVTLNFDQRSADLFVPLAAITAFVDPSVEFALHFQYSNAAQHELQKNYKKPDSIQNVEEKKAEKEDSNVVKVNFGTKE